MRPVVMQPVAQQAGCHTCGRRKCATARTTARRPGRT